MYHDYQQFHVTYSDFQWLNELGQPQPVCVCVGSLLQRFADADWQCHAGAYWTGWYPTDGYDLSSDRYWYPLVV